MHMHCMCPGFPCTQAPAYKCIPFLFSVEEVEGLLLVLLASQAQGSCPRVPSRSLRSVKPAPDGKLVWAWKDCCLLPRSGPSVPLFSFALPLAWAELLA